MAHVEGKRAISMFGTFAPAFLGSTIIELHQDRVLALRGDAEPCRKFMFNFTKKD